MVHMGVCCANLKDNKALMKMGLGLVLVGHVNFLLGALVHGAVLRHINVHPQARSTVHAVSNVVSIVTGLVGIISGISAIVLSKNQKKRALMWILLVISFVGGLLASASIVGLSMSIVRSFIHKGQGLLKHCKNPSAVGYASISNECPFDPTRIYETTIILWVPLAVMCLVEAVFSFHCFAACTSFLRLCRCTRKKVVNNKKVRIQMPKETSLPHSAKPEVESESEQDVEPAEQRELLNADSQAEESDWV